MNISRSNSTVLFEELRGLEIELHKDQTRRNRKRMEELLHPEFLEFGRSGRRYSLAEILDEFGKEFGPVNALPTVHSDHFELVVLAKGVALLTYLSSHLDAAGNPSRQTWRSSIWVHTDVGWQMRFHQGTPSSCASP